MLLAIQGNVFSLLYRSIPASMMKIVLPSSAAFDAMKIDFAEVEHFNSSSLRSLFYNPLQMLIYLLSVQFLTVAGSP
jgi:hypothetical protein